jgi:hypothetical protein
MENIVLAGIGILAYLFMRTLTGLKIFPLLHEILTALTGSAVKSTTQFREQTAVTFRRMSLDEKRKSMKYRYYCFINEVLAAFGLKQRGINVEGFTMSLIAIVIAISIVIALVTSSVAYALLLPIILLPTFIALIFLGSRMRVRKRKIELLDAMDILCAVMTDGILKAVKENYAQFPIDIQEYFKKFVSNIELLNMSVPQAVQELNEDIGSLYDEFCDSVITYEANRARGMETLFNFYISENGKTQARDRQIKRLSDSANMDYFASLLVIILFGVFSSVFLGGDSSLWATPLGKVVIVLLILGAVGVFIYIQYLLSKPFIYTEKDN